MKKFILCSLFVLAVLFATQLSANITSTDAISIVMNNIVAADSSSVNVYISEYAYLTNNRLELGYKNIQCPYSENWVFFIDDDVTANWSHPCRYVFVNCSDGEYQLFNEVLSPKNFSDFEALSVIDLPVSTITSPTRNYDRTSVANPHAYAVIINGNNSPPYFTRHWNEMSAVYSTLIKTYGYKAENIFIHTTDGTLAGNYTDTNTIPNIDFDGDLINESILPETYESISSTFSYLRQHMTYEDQLLIYVTGHGSL